MPVKRLQLIFLNAAGGRVTIAVLDPRENLTSTEVQAAMQAIIAANVFTSGGGDLVGIAGARVVSTETVEFEVA